MIQKFGYQFFIKKQNMFKIKYLNIIFVCFFLIFMPFATFGKDVKVILQDTKASNPECAAAALVSAASIAATSAGGLLDINGVILFNVTPPSPIAAAIIKATATTMVTVGTAAVIAGVIHAPEYFACKYSFVRHPVLHYEIKGPGYDEGDFRECKDSSPAFPSACRKTFQKEEDYFKCLDQSLGGKSASAASKDRGMDLEPRCRGGKFKRVSDYVWPQNRAPNSRFIEFCYRSAVSLEAGLSMGMSAIVHVFQKAEDVLDKRELDYGESSLQRAKVLLGGKLKCERLENGGSTTINGIKFAAIEREGLLCVDAVGMGVVPWLIKPQIGCHMKPSGPAAPMCATSKPINSPSGKVLSYDNRSCYSCYISDSCYSESGGHSLAYFPITSTIVSCMKESLDTMLNGDCVNARTGVKEQGFLLVAQKRLKNGVNAVLVIACMLIALKTALGGLQQPQSEIIMFVIKVAIVLYLTNGTAMSKYYEKLVDLSIGLSDIVLQAGGNQTICDYKASEYMQGGHDYSYLAPWDRLDCRLAFYFGAQLDGATAGTIFVLMLSASLMIVAFIFGNIYVIVTIVSMFATLMFIIVISWMVYLFILSMMALSLLILLSPLFLPMMLFQVTKNFFDSWIKEIMTYTLYPVMLFAFLGLMFTVYDNLFFGSLVFEREKVTLGKTTKERIWFKLKTTKGGKPLDQCYEPKNASVLACLLSSFQLKKRTWIFGIEVTDFSFNKSSTSGLWTRLGVLALLGFLFYHFLTILGGLAAELSGNPRGDLSKGVKSPAQMLQGAMGAAGKVRGAVQQVAKAGVNAIKKKKDGGKKEGDGKEVASSGSKSRASSGGEK